MKIILQELDAVVVVLVRRISFGIENVVLSFFLLIDISIRIHTFKFQWKYIQHKMHF